MRAAAVMFLFLVVACSSSEEPLDNGVNDVRAACEIRATWQNTGAEKCVNCMASAAAPACECETFKEFAGKCRRQDEARLAEASCTQPLKDCTFKCAKTDCACLEGCYATAEQCKRAAAATDGCVTEVCAPYCK